MTYCMALHVVVHSIDLVKLTCSTCLICSMSNLSHIAVLVQRHKLKLAATCVAHFAYKKHMKGL